MTNIEALTLNQQLPQLRTLTGVKLCYALMRFEGRVKGLHKRVQKFTQTTEQDVEFETRRVALLEAHCDRDDDGKPILVKVNGHQEFTGLKDNEEFTTQFEELKEEFAGTIATKEAQIRLQQQFLQQEVEFDVHQFEMAELPDSVTLEQMQILKPLLMDFEEETEDGEDEEEDE
jgi:hypothetical protein